MLRSNGPRPPEIQWYNSGCQQALALGAASQARRRERNTLINYLPRGLEVYPDF
jgi:hypothetical protein